TSMSAPMVAGAAALLFERDPTLTQDEVSVLLQAGAHPFRGAAPFQDQGGPGELDVAGALDALDQMKTPALALPSLGTSWITLSADYASADASAPVTAILELRTEDGDHRADLFDSSRLAPFVAIDGNVSTDAPVITRRAPGVYVYTYTPPAGLGGTKLSLGATFDGQPIVAPRTIPISPDIWTATYPTTAKGGGCTIARENEPISRFALLSLGLVAVGVRRRKRVAPI
ncbi:MAG TPA: S8 family serine peptidase, partial [Polyangiaceae bacterium]